MPIRTSRVVASKPRLLIVQSDPSAGEDLAALVRQLGYPVEGHYRSPAEAAHAGSKAELALVSLPGDDSFLGVDQIEALQRLDLPLLLVTPLRPSVLQLITELPVAGLTGAPFSELELAGALAVASMRRPASARRVSRPRAEEPRRQPAPADPDVVRRIDEDLRQAQKMEAIGRLAAGVAHDFNNLLTVIIGDTELALEDPVIGPRADTSLTRIRDVAFDGARLTQQLLAFSRRQPMRRMLVDVSEVVKQNGDMLRRVAGAAVELKVAAGADVPQVYIDRGQLEMVLVNLALNARDAMPDGGKLRISADAVQLRDGAFAGVPAGLYARIEMLDSGVGMPAETMHRIFEPFFTTKGLGQGTGLGLATVYGTVKQCGGFIFADSEAGVGTRFSILLPQAEGASADPAYRREEAMRMGSGTVLLVEDDDQVRATVALMLRQHGFVVAAAPGPAEAMALIDSGSQLHVVVTDVILRGVNARDLVTEVRRARPDLPCLFISGSDDEMLRARGIDPTGTDFLRKPFRGNELTQRISSLMEGVATRSVREPQTRSPDPT
jgi:two-component system, cell cycle sensor histidine kinase and response regulator CckA